MSDTTPRKSKRAIIILGVALLALVLLSHFAVSPNQAPTLQELSQTVVTCGDVELDNTQLGYYFWSEYSYYLMSCGTQIPATLDVSKPLHQQQYDDSTTWQDYILGKTMTTIQDTLSMVCAAQAVDFSLPAEQASALQTTLEEIQAKPLTLDMVKADGTADVTAYLQKSYGEGATMDSLTVYLQHAYLASAYADHLYNTPTFSDQEVDDYYDANGGSYVDKGVLKTDEKLTTIRMVLMAPTAVGSDEAWQTAENAAKNLQTAWLSEGGNEDDFSAMAAAHSDHVSSKSSGGLLTDITSQDLDPALAEWVFDQSRVHGDNTLVQTEDGWVIAYYVSQSDQALWQQTAEADLRQDTFISAYNQIIADYPAQIDYAKVALVQLENYVSEADKS